MLKIQSGVMELLYDEKNCALTIAHESGLWRSDLRFRPYFHVKKDTYYFDEMETVESGAFENGVGCGVRTLFAGGGYEFETLCWIEHATGDLICEWIPLSEGEGIEKVCWPAPMEFQKEEESWYSLINLRQGLLIPNGWTEKAGPLLFDGRFGAAGSYMPWFSQIKEQSGYLAICETPWNAGYYLDQPEKSSYTQIGIWHECSLGKMDYRRVVRYRFLENCDHSKICREYRSYAEEQGLVRTLREKAVVLPSIDRLIDCSFVHQGIKAVTQPDSRLYDKEHPEKNSAFTTFYDRTSQIKRLHEMGAGPLYVHLDGWAAPGYDNAHPDYFPVCTEAGGAPGLMHLQAELTEHQGMLGLHDQYRDYYLTAPTFSESEACRLTDGTIPKMQYWAGGTQSLLCTARAPYYVRRNFEKLFKEGIRPECVYLDVFTCNEGDECANPSHRMTRRESYEYRVKCFSWMEARGILSSSEEVNEWAVSKQIFCHYAPYDFMLREDGEEKRGIPVPLFNLVYHDCVIEPWMMDRPAENKDYMLYALLNAGAPYLVRDGAYDNVDGSFGEHVRLGITEQLGRCKKVRELFKKTAYSRMLSHTFVDGRSSVQKTEFEGNISVTVDFDKQTFEIQG